MDEIEIIKKKAKIDELLFEVDAPEVLQFFDFDSDEMLDEKIEVLEALRDGKQIDEIPDFYKILELMPEGEHWDV